MFDYFIQYAFEMYLCCVYCHNKDFPPPLFVCNSHCGTKVSINSSALSVYVFSLSTMNPLNIFIFFSLSKVELIKGNLQSVGLTLRLVQSTDGYAGHVIIETVAPNSPAALADLQRGDRLIAIGGNYANMQYGLHLQRKQRVEVEVLLSPLFS